MHLDSLKVHAISRISAFRTLGYSFKGNFVLSDHVTCVGGITWWAQLSSSGSTELSRCCGSLMDIQVDVI